MVLIPEEGSFSLSAFVTTPGYQTIIPQGYLVSKRNGETWIAPLIPQLFYGVDGQQLQTWRQEFTQTGSQVVLSRLGGEPSVPKEELYWRKVSDEREVEEERVEKKALTTKLLDFWNSLSAWQKVTLILLGVSSVTGIILISRGGHHSEVSEAEIQKEMKEHPWASREIAERIAKNHLYR